MNHTNRALNRIVLFAIGIVFLVAGALPLIALAWPAAADPWSSIGGAAQDWLVQADEATLIADTGLSVIALGAVALLVVLIIVLLALAVSSVRGRRSKTLLRSTGAQNPLGRVTVTEAFVSDAVTHSLASRDDILSSGVTADTVRSAPVLHVRVTPRQNTSPRLIAELVDRLVGNLATLTGQNTATYISIHTGLRARLARDQRRLS